MNMPTPAEAVQGELAQLALELGMKPYGEAFTKAVQEVTEAVELSLEKGDSSFKIVQQTIDRRAALASNPRPKLNYDVKKAARNISRLRRSSPEQRLGAKQSE